jgi:hypothetical protein
VGLATLLDAGLNVVPPAVSCSPSALAFGVRPWAVSAVTYGLLAWSFLADIIGGAVIASQWVLDTCLFHQMAAAPASSPNWTSGATVITLRRHRLSRARTRRAGTRASGTPRGPSWWSVAGTELLPWLRDR